MKKLCKALLKRVNIMLAHCHVRISTVSKYKIKPLSEKLLSADFIRTSTLAMLAEEIYEKNIDGSVAELGVYQGEFAKYINRNFPDRKLYLFDTFEGFDQKDTSIDVAGGWSNGNQDFSSTSINLVLNKMEYRDNCIIKKGFFPETVTDLEDRFCFVSIDADLYQPILAGLEYFYPRLSAGGGIMIHDYNNKHYAGAKQAVQEFCAKRDIRYLCIADVGGTAIVLK